MRRLIKAFLWLVLVLAVTVGAAHRLSSPAQPDAFYTWQLTGSEVPGQLLRTEPFARNMPEGAEAHRILYVTRKKDDTLAVASALIVLPRNHDAGPLPVVAWAHGTTGIAAGCGPTVMKKPLANVPAVPEALAQGWAIVATDYVGLGTVGGHAYLVGPEAARGVLDSVRAARQMQGVTLADSFVVWGHSQGGNSALWTGQLASQLAPDLQLKGTAAFAPASDLKSLVSVLGGSAFSKIVSAYLIKAYGQAYPDVAAEDYGIKSSPWLVDDIANRCVGDLGTLFSVAEAALLPATGLFAKDPTQGTLAQRLSENTPNGPFDRPVFVAQGDMDDLISPKLQQAYVASLCATGQPARLKEYPGLDHISLVAPQSPLTADLIDWTRERFAGGHPGQGC